MTPAEQAVLDEIVRCGVVWVGPGTYARLREAYPGTGFHQSGLPAVRVRVDPYIPDGVLIPGSAVRELAAIPLEHMIEQGLRSMSIAYADPEPT